MSFAEWYACLDAGLDLWAWESGVYPRHFKVRVMAFVNMRAAIKAHTEDAVSRYVNRKSNQKR